MIKTFLAEVNGTSESDWKWVQRKGWNVCGADGWTIASDRWTEDTESDEMGDKGE